MEWIGKNVEVVVEGFILNVTPKNSGMVVLSGEFSDIFIVSRFGEDIGTIKVNDPNVLVVKGRNLEVNDYSPNNVIISGIVNEIKPYRVNEYGKKLLQYRLIRGDQDE